MADERGSRPQDHEMCDAETKSRTRENIRRKVGLPRKPRESNETGQSVGEPDVPARLRISLGENRGDGERGNCVAGREAADAAEIASLRLLKPAVRKISARRNRCRAESAIDILDHTRKNFRVQDRLARQTARYAARTNLFVRGQWRKTQPGRSPYPARNWNR